MSDRDKLLRKASQCYLNAGLSDDACRCFDALGDYRRAARLHEEQNRWKEAAQAYAQAQSWLDAARCYLRSEQPAEAAQCYLNGDDKLQAAWIFAEQAHCFKRARSILQQQDFAADSLSDTLTRDIILARCEAGNGDAGKAGKYIHNVIHAFADLEPGPGRLRVEEWVLAVARHLGRPDLSVSLYAAACNAGVPEAEERWEAWAVKVLGDASGFMNC
ncbi:MAG: hypothetical protein GY862_07575 [Gammaproteobacteria bacterium]|nr:hypothetical protein [Gammaproteobacteria bacterium]